MFQAWIDPGVLEDAISPVTALVEEARIRFENGGLRVQTVDSANVGAVSLDLLADAFHSYDTEGEQITVDIKRMEEIVRRSSGHGNIMLDYDQEDRKLILKTGGYEFDQPLLVPETAREGIDPFEIETPAEVTINSGDLSEAIGIASMFSEQIKFEIDVSNEIFYMTARGDNESMHVTLDQSDLIDLLPEKAYGTYSINYLNDIRKAFPTDSAIHIGLGEELPLKLNYHIANENGRVTYGLAPRVDSA